MSTPLHIGPSVVACRHRRALQFGVSVLAIAAALGSARAQTVVGPGATVTNNSSTTGFYRLTGNGGTLINLGTISVSSAAAVEAYIQPFSNSDLSTYRISGITLNNSGSILAVNSNDLAAVSVNGFTVTNSGTMSNGGAGFPSLYLNFVNNLQFSNTGRISVDTTGTNARVANVYTVTNSNLTNNGVMAITATADTLPAVFISAGSSNVVFANNGTISTVGGGQAILVGNDSLNNFTTTIDGTNVVTEQPVATNIALNNTGLLSSNNLALTIGGRSSVVAVTNSGTIVTTSANGANAITVRDAANQTSIANSGLIMNSGAGSAIDISTSGASTFISNSGTISELGGNGIAIDHLNGSTPLSITTGGVINGGIRLSQPGDILAITGGAINGAVTASKSGAGTVAFGAAGFSTGGDFGSAESPLGAIVVGGGALNLNNSLWANSVTFGAGSTTTLGGTVNAVANNGNLNLAGGTLSLGTNQLVLGANATVRSSTADGSSINLTIANAQNGFINARAGNATIDTSANTVVIRPNIVGPIPTPGAVYAVIQTSPGANVTNALSKMTIAPGATASLFTIGTATTTKDAFGNALTPGKDIVLTVTGNSATVTNTTLAANNPQIDRAIVDAVVTSVTDRIGNAIADAIAGNIGAVPPGGIAGGDEPGHAWTVWGDVSGTYLSDNSSGRAFNGSIWTGLAGVDQPVTDNVIVGAVVGGEGDSFKLSSSGGRRSSTGISITPYAAYILTTWASVDVEVSYARLDNRITVTAGQPIGSHYQTNRVFAATNLSAFWTVDDLTLRGKIGFLIANTGGPRYTDATGVRSTPPSTTIQEAKLGGEATYHLGQFEPFLNLTLEDDLRGTGGLNTAQTGISSPSRYGLLYDAGLRYKAEGGIQVGFQAGGETLRGSQSQIMAGLFARIPL